MDPAKIFLRFCLLLFCSCSVAAHGRSQLERYSQCVDYLEATYVEPRPTKVLEIGPSLRRQLRLENIKLAVVLATYMTGQGHAIVLRPVSRATLNKSSVMAFQVKAGDIVYLDLTNEQYGEFWANSHQLGSITLEMFRSQIRLSKFHRSSGHSLKSPRSM